jgi:hypothetical protein
MSESVGAEVLTHMILPAMSEMRVRSRARLGISKGFASHKNHAPLAISAALSAELSILFYS